ncbi:MAG: ferritin-like domain-containing protein [Campylobacterales bacterium]
MLSNVEIEALNEAIIDEYEARAYYSAVLARFGDVEPFSNIVASETRHMEALKSLFRKYGVQIPPDEAYFEPPQSLQEACKTGVKEEIDNIKMYDRLLSVTDKEDIKNVFYHLQAASFNNHLPAFQNCLEKMDRSGGDIYSQFTNALNGDRDAITSLAQTAGNSFITGVIVGGVAGLLFSQLGKKH